MILNRLLIKELYASKLSSLSAVIALLSAITVLIISLSTLSSYKHKSLNYMQTKQHENQLLMGKLNQKIAVALSHLDYNITLIPKGQNIDNWYAEDFSEKLLPISLLDKLKNLRGLLHYCGQLRQRIEWKERNWQIIVAARTNSIDKEKYRMPAIGKISVGYEIADSLGIMVNDKISILGKKFIVEQCGTESGSDEKEDLTIWFNMVDLQNLLEKPKMISEILLLENVKNWLHPEKLKKNLIDILPNIKIIRHGSKLTVAAMIQYNTGKTMQNTLNSDAKELINNIKERKRFSLQIIILVVLISLAWLSMTIWHNINCRRVEIGIWHSLGVERKVVALLFLLKYFYTSIAGLIIGMGIGLLYVRNQALQVSFYELFVMIVVAIVLTMFITVLACLMPLQQILKLDVAQILQRRRV